MNCLRSLGFYLCTPLFRANKQMFGWLTLWAFYKKTRSRKALGQTWGDYGNTRSFVRVCSSRVRPTINCRIKAIDSELRLPVQCNNNALILKSDTFVLLPYGRTGWHNPCVNGAWSGQVARASEISFVLHTPRGAHCETTWPAKSRIFK